MKPCNKCMRNYHAIEVLAEMRQHFAVLVGFVTANKSFSDGELAVMRHLINQSETAVDAVREAP